MYTINVTMQKSDKTLTTRQIDGSNFSIYNCSKTNRKLQRKILLEWIEERANEQHNDTLKLVCWTLTSN